MDSVLTRKLFRDKYFQLHKPKKFNKGGITSIPKFQTGGFFTPQQEKAILGFTVAQELLEGKKVLVDLILEEHLQIYQEVFQNYQRQPLT